MSRADAMRRRYGLQTEDRPDVDDARVFFRNYRVRERDLPVWHVVSRRRARLPDGLWLDRASWMQVGDPWQRLLLVETYECRSRDAAQHLLAELLAQFQLPPTLFRVPSGAGAAFVDAVGANGVFLLGNVVVRIGSGTTVPAPAAAVAEHVRASMAARPRPAPADLSADISRPRMVRPRRRAVVGTPMPIEDVFRARAVPAGPPAPAAEEDSYLKVFSRLGEVRVDENDRLIFVPDATGEATIEMFDVRGDRANATQLAIAVDEPS